MGKVVWVDAIRRGRYAPRSLEQQKKDEGKEGAGGEGGEAADPLELEGPDRRRRKSGKQPKVQLSRSAAAPFEEEGRRLSRVQAFREVNRIVASELDRARLIDRVCSALVRLRAYRYAWIVLLDGPAAFAGASERGLEEESLRLFQMVHKRAFAPRWRTALQVTLQDPADGSLLACCLQKDENFYGALAVVLAEGGTAQEYERDFVREVSQNIGMALCRLERRARQGLEPG